MTQDRTSTAPTSDSIGRCLRQWRAIRRCKQSHIAEMLGVSQATISRWESGAHRPDEAERADLIALLQARLTTAADLQLARLIQSSTLPVHLVCDLTHRLLACSTARAAQLHRDVAEMLDVSLWPAATSEIRSAESDLGRLGWYEGAVLCHESHTRARSGELVDIRAGRFRWTRWRLSDGSFVRLVETLGG